MYFLMTNRIGEDQKAILSSRRRPSGESYPKKLKDSEVDREGLPENIEVPVL